MVNLSIIPQTDVYSCVTQNKEYDVYRDKNKLFIYDDNGQEDTYFLKNYNYAINLTGFDNYHLVDQLIKKIEQTEKLKINIE